MPWTCAECGVQGDRIKSSDVTPYTPGASASDRTCGRTGVAVISGMAQCCICAQRSGWEGFLEYGCGPCLRLGGVRMKPLRRAQTLKMDQTWLTSQFRDQGRAARAKRSTKSLFAEQWPLKAISEKQQEAKRMVIFDLDMVLLRTPTRPKWWPYHGYENMIESLLNPLVPDELTDDWFDAAALKRAREAASDPESWTVLVSFRPKPFTKRAEALLASVGVKFDELKFRHICSCCNPLGFTHQHVGGYDKLNIAAGHPPAHPQDRHRLVTVSSILKDCPCVSELEFWLPGHVEDLSTRAGIVARSLISTNRLRVVVVGVSTTPTVGGSPSAEYLEALTQATRALVLSRTRRSAISTAASAKSREVAVARGNNGIRVKVTRTRNLAKGDGRASQYYRKAAGRGNDAWHEEAYMHERMTRCRGNSKGWHTNFLGKAPFACNRSARRLAGRASAALVEDLEAWEPLSPGPEACSPTASRPSRIVLGDCWGAAAAFLDLDGNVPVGPGGEDVVFSCESGSDEAEGVDDDAWVGDEEAEAYAEDIEEREAYAEDVAFSQAFRAALGTAAPRDCAPVSGTGGSWEDCVRGSGAPGAKRAASVASTSGYSMCGDDDDDVSIIDYAPSDDAWSVVSGGVGSRRPSLLEPPAPSHQRERGEALASDEELIKFGSPPPLGGGYLAALISNAECKEEGELDDKVRGQGAGRGGKPGWCRQRDTPSTGPQKGMGPMGYEDEDAWWGCDETPRGWRGRKVHGGQWR
mmetsp:Transcript_33439/g.84504  ORF Transcript_33439/g.84504 Transcript_33439/m.84504 type:complete len:752 (+) Transcript_33439:96-2351(+)